MALPRVVCVPFLPRGRQPGRLLAVVAAVVVLGAAVMPVAAAAPSSEASLERMRRLLRSDFNGDGVADLVVGAPGEDVGSVGGAGAVNVLLGSAAGLVGGGGQLLTQGNAEAGDAFGSAVAAGDFDADGFADLAVGVPGESVGTAGGAGAVSVFTGSAGGLVGEVLFTQGAGGVGGQAEAGDGLGGALAAGDFNGDGFADLAVGAPGEDVGAVDAGVVNVLLGSPSGLTSVGNQVLTVGNPEAGDGLGRALAAGDFDLDGVSDLAVGAPGEDVGTKVDAGVVSLFKGSAGGLLATGPLLVQGQGGLGGVAEAGDLFGAALAAGNFLVTGHDSADDLAVGAPGEDLGSEVDAGAVNVVAGSADTGLQATAQIVTQSNPESGDRFGASLAVGFGIAAPDGVRDLAVGAPGEAVGTAASAGAVSVFDGTESGGLAGQTQLFTQGAGGVGGAAEAGDRFGVSLAVAEFGRVGAQDLAVGVDGEDLSGAADAGAVQVLYSSLNGGVSGSGSQLFTQGAGGVGGAVEAGDRFGAAVGGSRS